MSYLEQYQAEVATFVGVCHTLAANMYVTGHGGNLAWKLEDDVILITPTRMNKGDITLADVVFINGAGEVIEGTKKPTGETPMYVNFFRERPDIASVLHCHPPVTNAFAIAAGKEHLMRPYFPETATEVGPVVTVPYAEPLTQQLADNFLPYLQKYNAFLMENHGLVIMSPKDIYWCKMMTELLESTSISLVNALSFGPVKEISPQGLQDLENTMRDRELPMFGAPGANDGLVSLYAE